MRKKPMSKSRLQSKLMRRKLKPSLKPFPRETSPSEHRPVLVYSVCRESSSKTAVKFLFTMNCYHSKGF